MLATLAIALVLGGTAYDEVHDRAPLSTGAHRAAYDKTRFQLAHATLFDRNGLPAPISSTLPGGVPVPDVQWWGDDPTGALGITSHTFTASGSPTTGIDTPFCPSGGGWGDLSGCLQAVRFNGAPYYENTAATACDWEGGDLTVYAVLRLDPAQAGLINVAVNRNVTGADGWNMLVRGTGAAACWMSVEAGATAINATAGATSGTSGSWIICATSIDGDGNTITYWNGQAGAPQVTPAGPDASEHLLRIGANQGTSRFAGDIITLGCEASAWNASQHAAFARYWMGILEAGNRYTPTFSNTGPTCCWVDGAIECFGDDFPRLSCEVPPGATGAGATVGYHSHAATTNSILYSRDLTTGWTEIGAGVVSAAGSSPFRDGRTVYKITDDDAGSVEGISQALDITSLNTGDEVVVCAYSADPTDTVLDLQVAESGVCAGSTIDFAAATISSTWEQHQWTYTVADGTCTTATFKLAPTDWASAAATGDAGVVVMVMLTSPTNAASRCPTIYVETTSAAVTAGADQLSYAVSGPLVASDGSLDGQYRILADVAFTGVTRSDAYILAWHTGGSIGVNLYASGTANLVLHDVSGTIISAVPGWTVGQTYTIEARLNYDADSYSLIRDGTTLGSSTAARTSPTTTGTISIGMNAGSSWQPPYGAAISNVRIYR